MVDAEKLAEWTEELGRYAMRFSRVELARGCARLCSELIGKCYECKPVDDSIYWCPELKAELEVLREGIYLVRGRVALKLSARLEGQARPYR